MRVPITGGSPELIFPMRGDGPSCARPPSTLCAFSEESVDRRQLSFSAFDPVKGRGPELMRVDKDPASSYDWNLSPDGTRIVFMRGGSSLLEIRSLRGRPPQAIHVKGMTDMGVSAWAADGNGIFIYNRTKEVCSLLHVDLQGNAKVLWKSDGFNCGGMPSPDGRHLAIHDTKTSSNLWMLENF
jgi:hypothetical protein